MKKEHGHDPFSGFSAVFSGIFVSTCVFIFWVSISDVGGAVGAGGDEHQNPFIHLHD